MIRWLAALITFVVVFAQAESDHRSAMAAETLCSDSWYRFIEEAVPTGDSQGHGPDVGSDEWKSVIEFKLGIRDQPNLPDRGGKAWCRHIDQIVREKSAAATQNKAALEKQALPSGPSYDCDTVESGSVEEMICKDDELSALDRKLSMTYASAAKKATNAHLSVLKAQQLGWIEGRNDCWKADDKRACLREAYRLRIAELQATYRLVQERGPFGFICGENPTDEVIVTFFQTDPPTLIAERADRVALMVLQPSASGAKYQGRNETFWEHHGEATITWGYGAPPIHCKREP